MEDFVYERELWALRASVAAECGEELGELAKDLAHVVERNYFGVGCVEGELVFTALRDLMASEAVAFADLAGMAIELSGGARSAMVILDQADTAGAHVIGGK